MEPHLWPGERITFVKEVTDGVKTFAREGDTGTILKYWPHFSIYSVIGDRERAPDFQRFDCDSHYIQPEKGENNGKTAIF